MNITRRRREVAPYISCNNLAANTADLMSSYHSIVAQTFPLNKEKYDVFDEYRKAFHCIFPFFILSTIRCHVVIECTLSYINIVCKADFDNLLLKH